MNFLSYSPSLERAFEALGITILHSLWQGFLIMLLLWALLRFIRYEKANLRFILAFGCLMLMLLTFGSTFYYEWGSLKPLPTVNQAFSTETVLLTDLKVSADPSFWAQVKSEAYTLFYQLAENASLLAICWVVGSLLFSFRLSLGLWQIHQLKRERQTLPELWKAKSLELQQALGIRQKVEISTNNILDSPLTLGWFKPMILLPASMLMAMPAEQLESILVHELAHIRRHDYLWNLLQSMSEVIFFYHPAYWYIASVLEQEREHACDMITLKITGRPQVYAQALLQVASLRTTLSAVGLSACGRTKGRSGFAERIRRIVAPQQKKKGVQPLPFFISFCLIGFLLFAFTVKSPFEEKNKPLNQQAATSYDSLRAPDYVRHSSRMDLDIPLYKELVKSSSNQDDYIVGMARSSEKEINPWTYLKEEALYLLDGKVVDDPVSIMMSDIAKVEIYHEPLPDVLQNLSSHTYSTVVRALSEIPAAEAARSSIRVSGLVHTGKDGKVIPVPNIPVRIQSTGEQTVTNSNGRYEFSAVGKKDTLLFYLPSGKNALKVPVDNREHLSVTTYIPKKLYEDKSTDILKQRMAPDALKKDREAIDNRNRIGLADSSIYDVMEDIILIDPKTNTAKIKSDVPVSQNDPSTYYTIGDPEVLFTLDGVVTDPRTVDRKLVDGASFETQNVPDGYLVEIRAISKEAAEAARKESLKTVISGIVTDQKTGKPLPGTNILVKGTSHGTIADLSGRYQIEVSQGSGELVFAYTGYETRRETVNHRKILDISLTSSSQEELEKQPQDQKNQDSPENDNSLRIEGRLIETKNGKALVEKVGFFVGKLPIGTIFDHEGSQFDLQINQPADTLFYQFNDFKPKYLNLEQGKNLQIYFQRQQTQANLLANPIADTQGDKKLYIIDQTISDKNAPPLQFYDKDEAVKKYGKGVTQYNGVIAINPDFQPTLQPLQKAIIGSVTDAETGQPIPGVNVIISGTTTGTVTDNEGRYLLSLTKNAKSLSFNAIGYQSKTAMINKSEWLNIKLLSSDAAQTTKNQDSIFLSLMMW